MTTPVDRAPQRLQAAPEAAAVDAKTRAARWVPSLLTASMAIALAVREPPPVLDKDAYFLALSLIFTASVAGIMAAVWVANDPRGRRAAGSKLVYDSSIAALAVAAGLSVASLLLG